MSHGKSVDCGACGVFNGHAGWCSANQRRTNKPLASQPSAHGFPSHGIPDSEGPDVYTPAIRPLPEADGAPRRVAGESRVTMRTEDCESTRFENRTADATALAEEHERQPSTLEIDMVEIRARPSVEAAVDAAWEQVRATSIKVARYSRKLEKAERKLVKARKKHQGLKK